MSRFEEHIRELAREEAVKVIREAFDTGAEGASVLPGSGESGEEVAAVESPAPAATGPRRGKILVLVETLDQVVIITPRTLDRARGVVARQLLVSDAIAGQPGYGDVFEAIAPCFATRRPNEAAE